MRFNKIAFAVVIGLCATAQAEDNVFVDLSVLDNLNGSYVAPSEPLFPVLPKKEKVVQPKAQKQAKAKAKTPTRARKSSKKAVRTQPVAKPVVVAEPEVVVVDVEPVEAKPLPATVAPIVPEVNTPEIPVTENKNVEVDVITPEQPAEAQTAPVVVEEQTSELLIDEKETAPIVVSTETRSIIFADGEDELSSEQMAKIDDIIGKFKDLNSNKIAIYSYNLDDGVDSFRKKRISLNRAVGIRSYLLQQGYKNFSIKVININSGSDKINTVELEEI